jgi:hypothetical protein
MNNNILNQIAAAVKEPPGATQLKTQVEKVMLKTEPDEAPLTSAFLRELRRTTGGTKKNWPQGLLIDGRQPEFTFTDGLFTVYQISLQAQGYIGEPLYSQDELAKLRDIQTRMDAALEQAKKYSLSNAPAHLFKVRDQIEADVKAGKQLPESITMPSHDSVQRDFRAKQSAYINLLMKITHEELVPLAQAILQRFDRTVSELLKYMEIGDRAECEGYGVEYHPSVLWKACAAIAQRYAGEGKLPKSWAWATPRTILEGIVEI